MEHSSRTVGHRLKYFISALILGATLLFGLSFSQAEPHKSPASSTGTTVITAEASLDTNQSAATGLETLAIKGRAPKTGYTRAQFGDGWERSNGCDTRNRILARDLKDITYEVNSCLVVTGILNDPYTAKTISFMRGTETSSAVQIDHVVALSDAWQKGAQLLTPTLREALANDPLELLAVDGQANQIKSDGDAATWLPPNKDFRCSYVARQISVKIKYSLWVTPAEKGAMQDVLGQCPNEPLVK